MTEQQIEQILRSAPRPIVPGGLKEQLLSGIQAIAPSRRVTMKQFTRPSDSWFRRWWPALASVTLSLTCAAVLTLQQIEINQLKQNIGALAPPSPNASQLSQLGAGQKNASAVQIETSTNPQDEIARLKELKERLTAEIAQLEQIQARNAKLRAAAQMPSGGFSPEETDALAKARERAEAIQCVNNLKQLGLSVKVWALDHQDHYPEQILSMTNEMGSAKILVCPTDTGRQAAKDWASFTPANCSYQYLAPSGSDTEPNRVLFLCPIHGNVGLCDGSVQMRLWKDHPEQFVQKDGKLYVH